jgi:hypothetical protein
LTKVEDVLVSKRADFLRREVLLLLSEGESADMLSAGWRLHPVTAERLLIEEISIDKEGG